MAGKLPPQLSEPMVRGYLGYRLRRAGLAPAPLLVAERAAPVPPFGHQAQRGLTLTVAAARGKCTVTAEVQSLAGKVEKKIQARGGCAVADVNVLLDNVVHGLTIHRTAVVRKRRYRRAVQDNVRYNVRAAERERAHKHHQARAKHLLAQAKKHFAKGDFARALSAAKRSIKLDPSHHQSHLYLAGAACRLGRMSLVERALPRLKKRWRSAGEFCSMAPPKLISAPTKKRTR